MKWSDNQTEDILPIKVTLENQNGIKYALKQKHVSDSTVGHCSTTKTRKKIKGM